MRGKKGRQTEGPVDIRQADSRISVCVQLAGLRAVTAMSPSWLSVVLWAAGCSWER